MATLDYLNNAPEKSTTQLRLAHLEPIQVHH